MSFIVYPKPEWEKQYWEKMVCKYFLIATFLQYRRKHTESPKVEEVLGLSGKQRPGLCPFPPQPCGAPSAPLRILKFFGHSAWKPLAHRMSHLCVVLGCQIKFSSWPPRGSLHLTFVLQRGLWQAAGRSQCAVLLILEGVYRREHTKGKNGWCRMWVSVYVCMLAVTKVAGESTGCSFKFTFQVNNVCVFSLNSS